MKVSDSKLRNESLYTVKFFYRLGKIAPETTKLIKKAYKDNYFGKCTNFRWQLKKKFPCKTGF